MRLVQGVTRRWRHRWLKILAKVTPINQMARVVKLQVDEESRQKFIVNKLKIAVVISLYLANML